MNRTAKLEPEDILITDRLYRRRARLASLEAELAAYRELSALMAVDPVQAIQRFLDLAVELCPAAGSAGLSELVVGEEGEESFEWTAMSGAFACYVGGTTPRHFSPCGLCLDAHHTILVQEPARAFGYFNDAQPAIVEGLIVPLYDTGKRAIGTLWVTSHRPGRRFDPTDARIMEQLAVQLVLAIKLRRKAKILVQLEEAARDNEVLVKEVRHRVKNMIQMTSGLLLLQERGLVSAEAKAALRDAQSRLHVLASVYESLLSPAADVRQVDACGLIEALVSALRESSQLASRIEVHTRCATLLLDVGDAVPVGLIVNEAVTNSFKHAFAPKARGTIAVNLDVGDGGKCTLSIADDGAGFDGAAREGSLGFRLIKSLARQLKAELTIDGSAGTRVEVAWTLADKRAGRKMLFAESRH